MKNIVLLLASPILVAASAPQDYLSPYRVLEEANRTLDASLAATAYTSDGKLIFDLPGRPQERHVGRANIRSSYVRTFGQLDRGSSIDLEFRFDGAAPRSARHVGAYKAIVTIGGRKVATFGRFSAKLSFEDGAWRFAEDRGTIATAADFEMLQPLTKAR